MQQVLKGWKGLRAFDFFRFHVEQCCEFEKA